MVEVGETGRMRIRERQGRQVYLQIGVEMDERKVAGARDLEVARLTGAMQQN